MTTLNHTLALAALTFATFVVCSIIVMTVRQSLLTVLGQACKTLRIAYFTVLFM